MPDAPFAYDGLDRVIHEKARLGIMTSLAGRKTLTFTELKQLCDLSDGNLSRHLKMLEDAGLVRIEKRFEARRPVTTVTLTEAGRDRFVAYLAVLETVIRDAAGADEPQSGLHPKPA